MRKAETQASEPNAVIAPGEIRELLARLTQQSVEAIPAHESRTLEGLAVETGIPVTRLRDALAEMRGGKRLAVPLSAWLGFVFLALFAYWIVNHPVPNQTSSLAPAAPVAVAPKTPPIDLAGLGALTDVTYGPDGGAFQVDTGFEPTHRLPEGVSVAATSGPILWGSGDHRSKVLAKPLSDAEAKALRANVVELLEYVRAEAARRHVPLDAQGMIPVTLSSYMYYGGGGSMAALPLPGADDKRAAAAIEKAAATLLDGMQESLRQQARFQRQMGP